MEGKRSFVKTMNWMMKVQLLAVSVLLFGFVWMVYQTAERENFEARKNVLNIYAEQIESRLQIRPHFFLNAITTIASLSAQGKSREIEGYVRTLSKYIRYMFRSGIHTVPIQEEIQHVENYFEMQELRYPGRVFSFIDLPQELSSWKIPQMLLHTLIENEYKYGISADVPLMVLIRISMCSYHGEEMLMIEVEDDGQDFIRKRQDKV